MTDLIQANNSSARLVIDGDNIPFGAYQAIYHSLTRKTEQRTKKYDHAYDITFGDIRSLHQRLCQSIKQYNIKSSRCQLTHQFYDDTSREHSSFERFALSDCDTRSVTSVLTYEFDFLIILPAEIPEASDISQRYKLSVQFNQEGIDDPDIEKPYFLRKMFFGGSSIEVQIDFSDYSVSQTIYSVVDDWSATLPVRKRGRLGSAIKSTERSWQSYFAPLVRVAVLVGGAFAVSDAASVREALSIVLVFIAMSWLMSTIANSLIRKSFESLTDLRPFTNIVITQGDKDRVECLKKRRDRNRSILAILAVGVLLSASVSVASNFVYDALKDWF